MNRIVSIRIIFLLFLGYIGAGNLLAQSSIPPFKKGERVVFVGNSITHSGHYHSFVWLYYMTRFPDKPITIMNAGIGGESAWDIKDRLDEDVFKRKPTYMTLTFGMNDTGYDIYWKDNAKELSEQQVKKSLDNFKEIEERLLAKDKVIKVLIGGSPYDETTKISSFLFKNKNDAILKIIDAQRSTAAKNGWGFVDFNQPMVKISRDEQKKDSTFTFCRIDRIHPDNDGQMVMAYLFLKAQGLAGNEVAEVSIDANDSKVTGRKNCKISKLKKEEGSLSFDYLAKALPYPLDSISRHGWGNKRSQRDAMQLVPFMEEFNQERLQVANLEDGLYRLTIDGLLIDEVSSEQLANGINLADYPNTPQYQQAMKIMSYKIKHYIEHYPSPVTKISPIVYIDSCVYIFGNIAGEYDNENSNNRKVLMKYNLYSEKNDYLISYPEIYKENWNGTLFRWCYADYIYDKNVFLVSFPADHCLYLYNYQGECLSEKYAGSKLIDATLFVKKGKSTFIDADKRTRHFVESNSYSNILYDRYNGVYYRFAEMKSVYEGLPRWTKNISIIILDSKFDIIGETFIGAIPTTYRYSAFVSKKGLHLPKKTNEDKLSFSIYKLTMK